MKITKVALASILCAILTLSLSATAFADLADTDIRYDFCNKNLDKNYCFCAFDGNMCEKLGISQTSAENYVLNRYYFWLDKQRSIAKNSCEKQEGFWNNEGDKCVFCDGKTYLFGKKCQSKEEICGDNELAQYNAKEKKCYCSDGSTFHKGACLKSDGLLNDLKASVSSPQAQPLLWAILGAVFLGTFLVLRNRSNQ
ncbi:hypothetical protein KJ632_01295 [Patescibacteria group bacterium]|nr:hypothetical protein [Patescibacteria group bacterium]